DKLSDNVIRNEERRDVSFLREERKTNTDSNKLSTPYEQKGEAPKAQPVNIRESTNFSKRGESSYSSPVSPGINEQPPVIRSFKEAVQALKHLHSSTPPPAENVRHVVDSQRMRVDPFYRSLKIEERINTIAGKG